MLRLNTLGQSAIHLVQGVFYPVVYPFATDVGERYSDAVKRSGECRCFSASLKILNSLRNCSLFDLSLLKTVGGWPLRPPFGPPWPCGVVLAAAGGPSLPPLPPPPPLLPLRVGLPPPPPPLLEMARAIPVQWGAVVYTGLTTLVVVVAILAAVVADAPQGLKDELTLMVDLMAAADICGVVPGGSSLNISLAAAITFWGS